MLSAFLVPIKIGPGFWSRVPGVGPGFYSFPLFLKTGKNKNFNFSGDYCQIPLDRHLDKGIRFLLAR